AAYVRQFSSKVVALPPGALVLEQTFFYPTGGGQPCDLGRILTSDGRSFPVEDVRKSGPSVFHRLGKPSPPGAAPLKVGEAVEGKIDWRRRHAHMRLHSGQHLLSAVVFAGCGRRTQRATFSGNGGRIDLDGPAPSPDVLAAVVTRLNETIARDLPVQVRHVARSQWEAEPAARYGLVPLPPQVDPVRVIDFQGADVCPCGGTHVRATGEIGSVSAKTVPGPSPDEGRVEFSLDVAEPPTPDA
ncbi:MAG: alanyl-tRNA editing protein, partial [Thermoplasmata archaeon]|nr:alanyl-tRNA editing protein [Thermoplasmata archaeon]